MFTFSFEWWNWPKHRIAKCQIVVFSITINFIVQRLKFCKIEKEDTLITLFSAWDRSRDSKAKRNLSEHMWRSMVSKNNSHDPFILSCGFYCRVACITRNFSESQTPRFIFESGFKSRTGHNGTHRELKICKIWNIFWTLYNSFFHKLYIYF